MLAPASLRAGSKPDHDGGMWEGLKHETGALPELIPRNALEFFLPNSRRNKSSALENLECTFYASSGNHPIIVLSTETYGECAPLFKTDVAVGNDTPGSLLCRVHAYLHRRILD
jgi:hypothetical protein